MAEKLLAFAPRAEMSDSEHVESRLRARATPGSRPLGQLTNRQRGLRAANEVIKGTISPRSAQAEYGVDRHCLRYYSKQLADSGFAEAFAATSTPAATLGSEPPTGDERSSTDVPPQTKRVTLGHFAGLCKFRGVAKKSY